MEARRTVARAATATILLVVVLGSCTTSKVDPDARVEVAGRVVRANGAPVGGARVALTREPDLGEAIAVLASVGVACLEERAIDACDAARTATTDADGRVVYALRGRDTQGSVGNASVMQLATRIGPGSGQIDGPATSVRFLVQTEQVAIALPLWQPRLTLTGRGDRVVARWSALPPGSLPRGAGPAHARTSVVFSAGGGGVIWSAPGTTGNAVLDPRLLEDSRGGVSVVAAGNGIDVAEPDGTRIAFRLRSPIVAYAGTAGAPVSRGARCTATGSAGTAVAQAPCEVTDGDLTSRATVTACAGTDDRCTDRAEAVTLDLGRSRRIDLVVVRGCAAPCRVETSPDGRRWTAAGVGGATRFALTPARATTARYVRARGGIDELQEVSVWDRRPAASAEGSLIRPVEPQERLAPPPGGSQRRTGLWVAGALLLAAAAAGVGWAAGRRRGAAPAA